MIQGTYEANPAHRLVSPDGVMRLDGAVRDAFLSALKSIESQI